MHELILLKIKTLHVWEVLLLLILLVVVLVGRREGCPCDPRDWFGPDWQSSLLSSCPHPCSGCKKVNRFCSLIFIAKVKRLKDAREMESCEECF